MTNYTTGSIIQFGEYNWRVLDIQDDKALIITEDIVEVRPYDAEFTEEVWETCTLRKYLNSVFLQKFTQTDQERIIETKIYNPNNEWYGTWGGKNTIDKIFLLSLEEADKYFGDSGDYLNEQRKEFDFENNTFVTSDDGGWFSNENDSNRQAAYEGSPAFWWLRSPGIHNGSAAFVFDNGGVGVFGLDLYCILDVVCGVRPAMWVKL